MSKYASKKEADKFLSISLIKQIQEPPWKSRSLENGKNKHFFSLRQARKKLIDHMDFWLDAVQEKWKEIWYVDLGQGYLTWTSYNLILQFCREEHGIIICAYPSNLINHEWSGWTEVLSKKILDPVHFAPSDWYASSAPEPFVVQIQIETSWWKILSIGAYCVC